MKPPLTFKTIDELEKIIETTNGRYRDHFENEKDYYDFIDKIKDLKKRLGNGYLQYLVNGHYRFTKIHSKDSPYHVPKVFKGKKMASDDLDSRTTHHEGWIFLKYPLASLMFLSLELLNEKLSFDYIDRIYCFTAKTTLFSNGLVFDVHFSHGESNLKEGELYPKELRKWLDLIFEDRKIEIPLVKGNPL